MNKIKSASSILADLEYDQRCFVYSYLKGEPSQITAFISPRDGGKSYGALLYAIYVLLTHSNIAIRYIGPTYSQSKDIAWAILEDIHQKYELEHLEFKKGTLELYNPANNSTIKLYGADQDKLHDRFRGTHNSQLIIIDEAQAFESDLEAFINRVLQHTLTATGRLFLLGTPGEIQDTFFHKATTNQIPYIKTIQGTPFSNTFTADRVKARLNRAKEANPHIEHEPWAQREFLGKWVADNRKNIYHINPAMNYITELPLKLDEYPYHFIGIDFGYVDPTSRVHAVATPYELIYIHAEEETEEMLKDHVNHLQPIYNNRPSTIFIADPGGASKALTEELIQTYNIPIVTAIKQEKFLRIEAWNKDSSMGLIKVFNRDEPSNPAGNRLAVDASNLVWRINPKTGAKEEGKQPKHITDASLYIFNYWKKYCFRHKPAPQPKLTPHEYELRKMEKYVQSNRRKPPKRLGFQQELITYVLVQ